MQAENAHSSEFVERLSSAMNRSGHSQHSLAAALETTQSTVRGWLQGAMPRKRMLPLLAEALSVNAHWLLTGKPEENEAILETPRSVRRWARSPDGEVAFNSLGTVGDHIHNLRNALTMLESAKSMGDRFNALSSVDSFCEALKEAALSGRWNAEHLAPASDPRPKRQD